ncbi:TraR/DksA family transcriptional regulator [Naumannella huperziae]
MPATTFDDEIRAALAERRAALRALLESHADETERIRSDRDAEYDDEHDPEGSTLSAGWQLLDGLQRKELREIAEVDAALARLADGSYGICAGCGEPIPRDRLRARPAATRCVACASRTR